MEKHLYLMRHGETLFNKLRKIQGWCDSPLTPTVIKQAAAVRELIADIAFDHYYSSTSERCSDTLEIVTNYQVSYQRLKGLKERYFGDFEGESEDLNPKRGTGLDYDDIFPYYGREYFKDTQKRVVDTLTALMEKEDHINVLAVSHGGACYSFLKSVTDLRVVEDHGSFTNCCILHFTYDNHQFKFLDVVRPDLSI